MESLEEVARGKAPLLRGGAWELCGSRGVLSRYNNTPLHPSQEGNRTALRFFLNIPNY